MEEPVVVLGSGLNGDVVRIVSLRNSSMQYALKQIKKRSRSPYALREIELCLEIDHPHICKIFEVYESRDTVSLVMELCGAGDLYSHLKKEVRFNEITTILLTRQILKAVNYLHSIGIVHGDLKLENFVFARPHVLRLIDFGFAHKKNLPGPSGGSPLYRAPEPGVSTEQSDMWSVGVIVYMLLTGRVPETTGVVSDLRGNACKFVQACLDPNPSTRLTAAAACQHPWILSVDVRKQVPGEALLQVADLLLEFSHLKPLRRACLGLVAMHTSSFGSSLAHVETIFALMDKNGDGFVRESELVEFLQENKGLIPERLRVFAEIDLTGDGRINFSEFMAATEVFFDAQHSDQSDWAQRCLPELVSAVFRKLDVDNSGFISEANLRSVFGSKGYMGSGAWALMKEGDFLGDGKISQQEFAMLVRGGPS